MRPRTNYFLIGTFVLVGTALFVGAILVLSSGFFGRDALIVETYTTDSVQGLQPGALVRFRGVKIGEVTEITLVTALYDTDKPYVAIRAALTGIDPEMTPDELRQVIEQRVGQGMRVRLASSGLTGAAYLEADLLPDADTRYPPLAMDWTPRYPYIPSAPSVFSELESSMKDLLTMLKQTDLPGVASDVKHAATTLADAVSDADIPALVRRADDTLRDVAERANRLLDNGDALVTGVRESVDFRKIDGLASDLSDLVTKLEPSAAALHDTLGEVRTAAVELREQLRQKDRDLDSIFDNLRRMSARFAELADTLERYPSLLLLGTKPPQRVPGK